MGYAFQVLINKKIIHSPFDLLSIRKTLQKMAFLFFNPIATLGAIWILRFDNFGIIALPFLSILAHVLGGLLAFWFSKRFKLTRKQTGAYIVSGGFSNTGSIGGLLSFAFLGEAGFGLLPFYKLFDDFVTFGVGFPIAKSFSSDVNEIKSLGKRVKYLFTDIFILISVGSKLIGIILNISGIQRPDFFKSINAFFIPTGSILILASIGMAIQFGQSGRYIKEGLLIAIIKFAIIPVTAISIAYQLGFGNIDNGLPLKVVLILSCMPVAFTAMVPPTIYDLDVDIANASWLVTNFLLLLIIPILAFLVSVI